MERIVKTAVCIVAYAGDLERGAGGTCALMAASGYEVHVIVLAGDSDPSTTATHRRQAALAAIQLGLKAQNIRHASLRAGTIANDHRTVDDLRALIASERLDPVAVFTHSEAGADSDRLATAHIAQALFPRVPLFKFASGEAASSTRFSPSILCRVDRQLERKRRALRVYATDPAGTLAQNGDGRSAGASASGHDSRTCEAFELDAATNSGDIHELMRLLDCSAFAQFWSPLIAASKSKLNVLASGAYGEQRSGSDLGELLFLVRLQSRLLAAAPLRIGENPEQKFEVHLARGRPDTHLAEAGHVLVLGHPLVNPAADATLDWLGLRPYLRDLHHARRRDHRGLLTIAKNPLATRHGIKAFILAATGHTPAATMAAANCLLDETMISRILPEAREVFEGRLAIVQIEVAPDQDAAGDMRAASKSGQRRSSSRAA